MIPISNTERWTGRCNSVTASARTRSHGRDDNTQSGPTRRSFVVDLPNTPLSQFAHRLHCVHDRYRATNRRIVLKSAQGVEHREVGGNRTDPARANYAAPIDENGGRSSSNPESLKRRRPDDKPDASRSKVLLELEDGRGPVCKKEARRDTLRDGPSRERIETCGVIAALVAFVVEKNEQPHAVLSNDRTAHPSSVQRRVTPLESQGANARKTQAPNPLKRNI